MPFRSKAQQAYLEINNPEVAKKFAQDTPKSAYARLPKKVKKKTKNGPKKSHM